jgi:hypothetical protein
MAGTTTGNLFDIEAPVFEEIINKDVDIILPTLDPAWRDTFVSNQGVFPTNQLGRQWQAIRVLRGTYTGVIDGGTARDDFTLYGENYTRWTDKTMMQDIEQTWPDPLEGPKPGSIRMKFGLESMHTNLALSWQEMQAEATPAYIGQVIAPIMTGFAKNMAHQLCNFWYTSQSDSYAMCTVRAVTSNWAAHGTYTGVWFADITTTEYTPNRFYRGQRVDIYGADIEYSSSTSTGIMVPSGAGGQRLNDTKAAEGSQTAATRVNVIVGHVDELANTVRLVTNVDPATWRNSFAGGSDIEVGDAIVPANIKKGTGNFTGIPGINSWLKGGAGGDDNYLLGAERDGTDFVDVTEHPEYKSLKASINDSLTEPFLLAFLRRFHAAKDRYGMGIDCLIASDGVWLEYFRQLVPQFTRERAGRLANITDEGLKQGFSFTADGRTYMGYTSNYIEDGTVYGIKKGGGNWERIVPPYPAGASNMGEMEGFIPFRFVLPAILGTNQTRALIYDSSNANSRSMVTSFVQLPGVVHLSLAPKMPVGIKMTNVTSYTYWP